MSNYRNLTQLHSMGLGQALGALPQAQVLLNQAADWLQAASGDPGSRLSQEVRDEMRSHAETIKAFSCTLMKDIYHPISKLSERDGEPETDA